MERLQAWKHACGYLEDYITATEKMQKAHSKEYEKVLKESVGFPEQTVCLTDILLDDFTSAERGPSF